VADRADTRRECVHKSASFFFQAYVIYFYFIYLEKNICMESAAENEEEDRGVQL